MKLLLWYQVSLIIILKVGLFLIVLFSGSNKKDIEANVLDIAYENSRYFVNISLKNNQDKMGWISDTYLETAEGSVIDITGAGIDKKVESKKTKYLQSFSADAVESTANPPFKLIYSVFPSENSYSVEI